MQQLEILEHFSMRGIVIQLISWTELNPASDILLLTRNKEESNAPMMRPRFSALS